MRLCIKFALFLSVLLSGIQPTVHAFDFKAFVANVPKMLVIDDKKINYAFAACFIGMVGYIVYKLCQSQKKKEKIIAISQDAREVVAEVLKCAHANDREFEININNELAPLIMRVKETFNEWKRSNFSDNELNGRYIGAYNALVRYCNEKNEVVKNEKNN